MTIKDFPYSANDDAETLAVPLYLIVTLEPVGGESSNLSPVSTNLYIENSANDDVETLAVTRGDESSFGTIRLCLNHSLGFGRSLTFLSKNFLTDKLSFAVLRRCQPPKHLPFNPSPSRSYKNENRTRGWESNKGSVYLKSESIARI